MAAPNYNPPDRGAEGETLTFAIPEACAGLRLDQALARLMPEHSRSRIRSWIDAGRVLVDGSGGSAKRKLWGGERVAVSPLSDPELTVFTPQSLPLSVLFGDESIIVVDKPAGLVVHPGSGNRDGTLANALLHYAPELALVPRAGIVHRLDKDTSGLLVVARSPTAQTDLVRQLQARSVSREYLALAHGSIARDGVIDAPIARHPVKRTSMAVVAGGKPAITHFAIRERFADCTLLTCRLETGRTHQIRVHLASIGHPLVGDPVYGRRRGIEFERQALHAWRLGLLHPATREPMRWTSPLPADFSGLLAELSPRSRVARDDDE